MSKKVLVEIHEEGGRGPHRHDADLVTDFSRMNVAVVPRSTAHGTSDQHASDPDWSQGWYLQDRNTGQPVPGWSVENGEPPEFLKECWRQSNRRIVGVIVGRDEARHN